MLQGKRIGIIVENKFIFEEIEAYKSCFALLGAKVDFISRLSDKAATQTFYSDVDPFEDPWTTPRPLKVSLDFSSVNVEDYSAIIMVANYPSVRLRWTENPAKGPDVDVPAHVASAPAVKFFASAMRNSTVVKGALCHGLWIATPIPKNLSGRRVTCHTVLMADVQNCGAQIAFGPDGPLPVVVDGDLVTGYSKNEVVPFIEAIANLIVEKSSRSVWRQP